MKTLYLSDLDGTLLRSDQKVSAYTARTINRLVGEGMYFSYATARSMITARKAAQGIDARIPLILYNGAFIMDNKTGELLLTNLFEKNAVSELIHDLLSGGVYPIVYSLNGEKERFRYVKGRINRPTQEFIDTRRGDSRDTPISDPEELLSGMLFYVSCIGEAEKLSAYYEKYCAVHRCIFHEDVYSHEMWLEIMPEGASKANAARQLKEWLGCQRITAFGDGKNDVDLFALADECYAVRNAVDELKGMATGVIGSNDEDGVAKWLAEQWDKKPEV